MVLELKFLGNILLLDPMSSSLKWEPFKLPYNKGVMRIQWVNKYKVWHSAWHQEACNKH